MGLARQQLGCFPSQPAALDFSGVLHIAALPSAHHNNSIWAMDEKAHGLMIWPQRDENARLL